MTFSFPKMNEDRRLIYTYQFTLIVEAVLIILVIEIASRLQLHNVIQ